MIECTHKHEDYFKCAVCSGVPAKDNPCVFEDCKNEGDYIDENKAPLCSFHAGFAVQHCRAKVTEIKK